MESIAISRKKDPTPFGVGSLNGILTVLISVLIQVYALVVENRASLHLAVEVLAYGHLGVAVIFLLYETSLFEEFVETAVCDVLNHSLGKVCSLLGANLSCDFSGFVSLFTCEPSLGDVALLRGLRCLRGWG